MLNILENKHIFFIYTNPAPMVFKSQSLEVRHFTFSGIQQLCVIFPQEKLYQVKKISYENNRYKPLVDKETKNSISKQ